jgi:ribosomal protein S18 acetylase RimI-like enzyme
MTRLRPFAAEDEAGATMVCTRTADNGGDATGLLRDDQLWADIFLLPYLAHEPELALVLESERGQIIGYAVATADTDAFETWFHDQWWPGRAAHYKGDLPERDAQLIDYASNRGTQPIPYAAEYPAHLHIDLLPEAQGAGWGRTLITELFDALRAKGVAGVHLVASGRNTGAVAFYRRLGFTQLPADEADAAFGLSLLD